MTKCGCGDVCDCLVEGGIGTDVPGTGDIGNPYVVNVDGSKIAGQGIGWQGDAFHVRLANGGGLGFDANGNLLATGGGGGGSGTATVKALEGLTKDVVGGHCGAGFYVKPIDQLSSFTYGLQQQLDFLHVQVRFLMDGSPVVSLLETTDYTNRSGLHVQDQDAQRWQTLTSKPGAHYFHWLAEDFTSGWAPPLTYPRTNWFGYLEQGQIGLTLLSDVFREVGGKIVLVLQLLFPARNSPGSQDYFAHPTPSWRTDLFLTQVRSMIQRCGMQNSVIITSNETHIPSAMNPPTIDVLQFFADAGLIVGPYIDTPEMAAANPPDATWPEKWTWVFLSRALPRTTLAPYITRPDPLPKLHSILFLVSRQYLRSALVNDSSQTPGASGVGAKGVLSADPEYYAAQWNGYRTRTGLPSANFDFGTVKNGMIPAGDEALANMSWMQRGFFETGLKRMWPGVQVPRDPAGRSQWLPCGWMNPIDINPLPTVPWTWDIGLGFNSMPSGQYGWMCVAFGVNTDHGFRDRALNLGPDPDNYPLDSGYMFIIDTNGYMFLYVYDRGGGTQLQTQQRPYGAPVAGVPMYVRISLNPNGIKISRITAPGSENPTGAVIIQDTSDLAKQFRGGYFYLGKYMQSSTPAFDGFIDNPMAYFGWDNGPAA